MLAILRQFKERRSPASLGVILAFFGTLLFSFKSIVVKLAYQWDIDSEQLIALRMLISAPIYLLLLLWHYQKQPFSSQVVLRYFWLLVFAGLSGYYLASFLDLWGLEMISAQLERLILFTYPGFVMLLSLIFWKKVPTKITVLALVITYIGIAVVVGVEAQNQAQTVLMGGALVLLSALLFAAYLVLSKTGIQALGSQVFTCFAMLAASLAVAIHMILLGDVQLLALPIQAYLWAAIMSVFCTVIPSLLIAAAIARLGPQLVSILGGLGPVMTAFMAVAILGEAFGWSHFVGTVLVVTGAWLVVFEAKSS